MKRLSHHLASRLRVLPELTLDDRQSPAVIDEYRIDRAGICAEFLAERHQRPKRRIDVISGNDFGMVKQSISEPSLILSLHLGEVHPLAFFNASCLIEQHKIPVHEHPPSRSACPERRPKTTCCPDGLVG